MIEAVDSGRGFAIIDRLPIEQYSLEQAKFAYWIIGRMIGVPFKQNVKGTLLYDGRDTGAMVEDGIRFSITNAESTFHTDNSFGESIPDIVGLLCLRTSRTGGRSQLVSAYSVHNELLLHHPDVLKTLYGDYYFDRRGEHTPDEPPVTQTQVFHWDGSELTTRYLHYYIQVGHEKMEKPLTIDQKHALSVIEELLLRQELRVEFRLEPGQLLFVNNRWTLHNRTEFEDHPEPELRRHYLEAVPNPPEFGTASMVAMAGANTSLVRSGV